MIAYAKGNLEDILDINFVWSLNVILIYYIVVIFIMHAAFHQLQADALKRVVMLYSLEKTDIIDDPNDQNQTKEMSKRRTVVEK
jgi:hypothetical protein